MGFEEVIGVTTLFQFFRTACSDPDQLMEKR
jgi:hypothetical protein